MPATSNSTRHGRRYRVTPAGSILNSFYLATDEVGAAHAFASNVLYTTRNTGNRLFVRNPTTGSVISTHNLSFAPNDVGYDSRGYLWIASAQRGYIYQTTTAGSIINSFAVTPGTPYGCDFDGTYVWVGTVGATHMLYRYEVGLGGAVEPASVGRIKAIYR